MKVPFSGILLAALAVTPSLGSLFEHQPDIAGLARDPDSPGRIQLSNTGHKIQSVNGKGEVLDEIQLTAAQEAELRSSFAAQLDRVMAGGDSPAVSNKRARSPLDKKAPGCADWASLCVEPADCYYYNCDDCFRINPIGACYSYS
ncbi:uncharacterized protein NFIA_005450 [Aspergillus fischeri NRRL 181]|uniref:Uncharacterized protein n=1 Tax=Neosartorya fischeri (strain ATCC 1020 / DSM 3700 / CBS 544.65 / FGSC A1164 / JCM 1740 / NRRL 181 / WB 181) TaxID=331117 RepID=A1DKE4_NEOFI|nr:uncharacterized protein NFIA_005450 [Aspergillus fischeri NRRL 181]EAW17183.1 predicted protein [Aspergillus fischeri NRRL 181]KAG2003963.1 hypothetical protein GB937_009200 [Aspergillus fischeri]